MPSIENLYWILYENLLKPVGLDGWYYYPFGTQNNLSMMGEFQPLQPRQEHHVLFHYDQEPIWTDNLGGHYEATKLAWSGKLVKILANSEHSMIKKTICRERSMLDWYFFFHGFAAAHWYRDSQHIDLDIVPTKVFSSYNHQVQHKRSYRMAITARLQEHNLAAYGDISFHAGRQQVIAEIDDPHSALTDHDKNLITRTLLSCNDLPLVLDKKKIDGTASADFGRQEYLQMQNSFVHLVNETVFYEQKQHLTEKIFRPIVVLRPFILVAAPGNLAYLKSYGFRTFDLWWDESYDDIEDHNERSDRIVSIIKELCRKSPKELRQLHDEMKSVLCHNKTHFFGAFRHIIVDELVDNFDQCIRVWNNGRVDGRERPLLNDLTRVKKLLQGSFYR